MSGGQSHRRQYLPGSRDRITKREALTFARKTAADNRAIVEQANRIAIRAKAERDEREKRDNSGIRGFINRVKRFLTQPVKIGSARTR